MVILLRFKAKKSSVKFCTRCVDTDALFILSGDVNIVTFHVERNAAVSEVEDDEKDWDNKGTSAAGEKEINCAKITRLESAEDDLKRAKLVHHCSTR